MPKLPAFPAKMGRFTSILTSLLRNLAKLVGILLVFVLILEI